MRVKIYRSVAKYGTVIATELLTEINDFDDSDTLEDQFEGDFIVEDFNETLSQGTFYAY